MDIGDVSIEVHASVGLTLSDDPLERAEEGPRAGADRAMYEAKHKGRALSKRWTTVGR